MTRRGRISTSDEGAMLIIALAIITVVALVSAALLTLGGGKFAATASLRKVTSNGYAADAAAKIAIDNLVQGSSAAGFNSNTDLPSTASAPWVFDNNADGTGCFGGSDGSKGPVAKSTLNLTSFYSDSQSNTTKNATVTCAVVPGTGIFGTSGGVGSTGGAPGSSGSGRAITLLGSTGGSFGAKSGSYMVHGDIMSKGPVSGTDITTGKVYASSCSASAGEAGTTCPFGGNVDDPYLGVSPNITSVPTTLGTWSNCTFQPGYYDDATALTSATDTCPTSTFAPGNYYFDFHNNTSDPTYSANSGIQSGADVWTVSNTVVGGQPVSGVSQPPGMCKSPITDTTAQGVQFIFGGDSQMTLSKDGIAELCGSYNNGTPPIVLYGLDGSSAARGSVASGYATTSSQTSTGSTATSGTFVASSGALPAAVGATGGATANWPASGQTTANNPSIVVSGFGGVSGVPAGSILTSAKVTLVHKESTGTPKLAYAMGTCAGTGSGLSSQSAWTTQTVDLSSALSGCLGSAFQTGGSAINTALNNLNLTYSVGTSGSAAKDAHLDAMQLVLTYYPPYWRGETSIAIPSNCLILRTNSQCDIFGLSASGGSGKNLLVVNGVTYVPAGSVGGNISNHSLVVALRWGLVADSASFSGWPQATFGYPLVSIPDAGPGIGSNATAVDLKVYLCASGTCATSGTPALTARVLFTDPIDSSTNVITAYPNTRQVNVLSWAEQK